MLNFIKEKQSCWDYLYSCKKPIFIYGMGDGALKIMSVMKDFNISINGIFASDEYVRGHSFEGFKVQRLSEIEEQHDDFIIVLAFAAGYESLYNKIFEIAQRHTVLAPDVPVAGDGLFTYEYCLENAEKIQKTYDLLYDEYSKKVFAEVINFKISGKIQYLDSITTPKDEVYTDIIKPNQNETYIDLGAYNGDTVMEFIDFTDNKYNRIIALEPDKKNFKKLKKTIDKLDKIEIYNAAAWNEDTTLMFSNKAGRMSTVSTNGNETEAFSVDSILNGEIATIIKMDVEGSEKEAIFGAEKTIRKFSPKLLISLYHRNEDMFYLPLLINSINPSYKFYMRHQLYIPAWETNLYCTL